MISAKDIFILEREMMAELNSLIYGAGLGSEEKEAIYTALDSMDAPQYDELVKSLASRQISPLTRLKFGETLSAKEINHAVQKAANESE